MGAGESHNLSWNCGVEGVTEDARINTLRLRQQRNFAAALLLAQGVPMILMGDEYGHSKDGNNNTYCHDSRWNYLDWRRAWDDEHGLRRFWSLLIHFRRKRPELGTAHALHGEVPSHPYAHMLSMHRRAAALGCARGLHVSHDDLRRVISDVGAHMPAAAQICECKR
jgi:pullulanase/glycogen debranching enzyme